MRIGPDIWGPHAWKFLHMIALAYPNEPTEDQKKHYKDFYELLKFILPCSICANHFKENIENDLPITNEVLKNKDSFVKWSIDLHNLVNKQTGKPEIPLEEALQLIYNNFPDNNKKNDEPTGQINKNIDFKIKIDKDNIKETEYSKQNNSESSSFYSFSFLFIVFFILITIAIVYKKDIPSLQTIIPSSI